MTAGSGEIRKGAAVTASVCLTCGKRWDAQLHVCPEDGTALALQSGEIEIDPSLRGDMDTALEEAGGEDLRPGTVVGEYVVEGKLGQGGMGAVYAATHPLIGKKAAIKVISDALCTDTAAVERFVQEARSVNQI